MVVFLCFQFCVWFDQRWIFKQAPQSLLLRMLGLYQPSRSIKMAVKWRKLYVLVMICWNTPLGITACRTLDLVLLLMYTPFLPRRLNKLRNSPQFIQSYDPLTKWSFDTCDIQKPHNNLVSSQCPWNQDII